MFRGKSWISVYIYNWILEKNNSDCFFDVVNFWNGKAQLIIGRKWSRGKVYEEIYETELKQPYYTLKTAKGKDKTI